MTLTDDNGIATVNLKLEGVSVPVSFEEGAKSITYTFTQVGNYTLELYDVAGNRTKEIAFTIE